MRKLFPLFLLLCSISVIAQDVDDPFPLPDSLAGRLREFRETNLARAEALDAAIMFYYEKDRILDAQGYINELTLVAKELKDNYYIALSDYYLGFCELRRFNYLACINKLNEALGRVELLRLTKPVRLLSGKIYLTKGSCLYAMNMFPESFETIKKGLEVVGDSEMKLRGRLLNDLGTIYADIENSRGALEAFQQALETDQIGEYYYNIATVYCDMTCFDSALMYVDSALLHSVSLKDSIRAKQLRGVVYRQLGDLASSNRCFEECLVDLWRCDDPTMIVTVSMNSALTALQNGDRQKAMDLVNDAVESARMLGEDHKTKDCLRLKAWIMGEVGDYENALSCMFQFDSMRESMLSRQNRDRMNEMIRQQETMRLEQEFEVERKVHRQRLRYISIIALLTLMLTLSVVFFLIRDKRQKELLLKQELDLRNREVTSKAMSQMQTNEVLNEVIEKLTHLANNPKGTVDPLPMAIRELKGRVDNGAKTDFDYYFVQVHPDFYAHLKADFPNLSQNELRLCALIRANLNIKEIANLNNVSIDSVKSSRKRLRKSLGIVDPNVDLAEFLSKY